MQKTDVLPLKGESQQKERAQPWPTELIIDPELVVKFRQLLAQHFQESRTLDRTLYWEMWHEMKQSFSTLFHNPPVAKYEAAPRILIVGTRVQIGDWADFIGSKVQVVEGRPIEASNQEMYGGDKKLTVYDKLIIDLESGSKFPLPLVYCSNCDNFWKEFFASKRYLDEVALTVPSLIIASGEMRYYDNRGAGTTIGVKERLSEIASHFGIPIVFGTVTNGSLALANQEKLVASRAIAPYLKS